MNILWWTDSRMCREVRAVRPDFDSPGGNNYLPRRKQLFRLNKRCEPCLQRTDIMRKTGRHVEMDSLNCCWLLDFDFNRNCTGLKTSNRNSAAVCAQNHLWTLLFIRRPKMLRSELPRLWRHLDRSCYLHGLRVQANSQNPDWGHGGGELFICVFIFSSQTSRMRVFQTSPWKQRRPAAISTSLSNDKSQVISD